MAKFTSRDIAAIAICGALWAVLGATIGPIFWSLTHLPFLCDMIGATVLILALWWVRKLGAITATGIIATILTLIIRPQSVHFLGFTAASVVFDILARGVGYRNSLDRPLMSTASLILISMISTATAGVIIGLLFMRPTMLVMIGGLYVFSGLHAIGGLIGSVIGVALIRALSTRIVLPHTEKNVSSTERV